MLFGNENSFTVVHRQCNVQYEHHKRFLSREQRHPFAELLHRRWRARKNAGDKITDRTSYEAECEHKTRAIRKL